MSYAEQKKFFETAYKTGTDLWTDKLYQSKIFEYLSRLPSGGMSLDLGTGRGRWPFAMVEMGFRVIGMDYVSHLIDINNHEAKAKNMQGKIRFVEGSVFEINFADGSFDIITDFGLLQHLQMDEWPKYGQEVSRVLKSGGFILNVSLSKETRSFLGLSPKEMSLADFDKYGAHYHFFDVDEIRSVYGYDFKVVNSEVLHLPKEQEALIITLLRKN